MNAVTADAPSDHVDDITRSGGLVVALSPVSQPARHDADSTAVDQRLADVPLVEDHGSVDCWDSRLVAARADSRVHAPEHPRRVEQAPW